MTQLQYDDDVYAKSCKVSDVYDHFALKDIFIESVGFFIHHSLRKSWASNQQSDPTNIAFKAQLLLAIQKGVTETSHTKHRNASKKKYGNSCHNKTARVGDARPATMTAPLSRRRPESSLGLAIYVVTSFVTSTGAPPSSSTLLSYGISTRKKCYGSPIATLGC